jgi:hypothetical protein
MRSAPKLFTHLRKLLKSKQMRPPSERTRNPRLVGRRGPQMKYRTGQQRWFKFALVFLTGIVIGVSVEWLNRKSDEKNAFELRSLGTKFRSLSDNIKIRTVSSGWPDNVRDLKPAILSVFISAKKFDLWAPNEHVYQLPDASFLCEYFRFVGKLLEDGHFDEANNEALSWKPFLDKVKLS